MALAKCTAVPQNDDLYHLRTLVPFAAAVSHCFLLLFAVCAPQYSQQQGNRCRSVLSFVAKESVDLLIIGLYKAHSRRKGLALKGNALTLASRCVYSVCAEVWRAWVDCGSDAYLQSCAGAAAVVQVPLGDSCSAVPDWKPIPLHVCDVCAGGTNNRCACSCLVVPMSESALVASAEAADLEATAEEEEELVSGSEDDSGARMAWLGH